MTDRYCPGCHKNLDTNQCCCYLTEADKTPAQHECRDCQYWKMTPVYPLGSAGFMLSDKGQCEHPMLMIPSHPCIQINPIRYSHETGCDFWIKNETDLSEDKS